MGQAERAIDAVGVDGARCNQSLDVVVSSEERPATSILEEWSDLDLVAAVVSRDDGAFAELFRRHHHSIMLSSRMILGNSSQCEDVSADVLFDFWLEPQKYDPARSSLLSFLRVRAKSRCVDLIRTETARSCREQRDAGHTPTFDSGPGLTDFVAEPITGLRGGLALLPPHEREPIELAFFAGMTYHAIAQHLVLAENMVKSRIQGGLERLRVVCVPDETAHHHL